MKSIIISIKNAMIVVTSKKDNMQLYKLNLPNGTINNIIYYALGKEDLCKICRNWRFHKQILEHHLDIKMFNERNVEDDILIFLTVYKIPPYSYVRAFLKISEKKYEMVGRILWVLVYRRKEGEDVKENTKLCIESKKFNVQNTVRYINIIFKMMYERSKICQLDYYPELKL